MDPLPSMLDFVLAVAAAFIGGTLMRRLGQPPVVGYLVAGIILGPSVLSFIDDTSRITTLADIGVAFLMFQAGTSLSMSQLRRMQGIAIAGPWVQFLLMAPFVVAAILWTRMPATELSYLGIIVALSSTTVVVKMMTERRELDTPHGRSAIAFSMVQDLPMVPTIIVFAALGTASQLGGGAMAHEITLALGKALAFVVVAYVVGMKVIPPLLKKVAAEGSEVLLLAVIAIALGMAYTSSLMGVSMVLGAFIAGLVVAESEVNFRIFKELSPVSDLFATFFFLSVGMLLDISFVVGHIPQVLLIVAIVMIGKPVILTAVGLLFKQSAASSLLFGLALAQIGEEAFVLAQVGLSEGVLSPSMYSLVLSGAVVSIVLSPVLMNCSGVLLHMAQSLPVLGQGFVELGRSRTNGVTEWSGHAVICGYGQVGRELAQALDRRGVRYVVIERAPYLVAPLREKGVPVIVGDATNEAVLNKAGIQRASTLAVTLPDPKMTESVVLAARKLRKGLPIIVRGTGSEREMEALQMAGATEVVHPSFEASLGFIRMVLRGSGVSSREVERTVLSKRIGFYG
ncbi:MAG: hypothetical protein EXR48_07405 [Dehalococcoidia bacterium]|nr:hypothetical protein [Dehalococcoidia bacterium]